MSFTRPFKVLSLVGILLVAVLFGGCGTTREMTKDRAGHIALSYVRQQYKKSHSNLTRSVIGAKPGLHHIQREGNVWRVQVFVGGAKMIPQLHTMTVDDDGHIGNHTTKDLPAKSGPPPIPKE